MFQDTSYKYFVKTWIYLVKVVVKYLAKNK